MIHEKDETVERAPATESNTEATSIGRVRIAERYQLLDQPKTVTPEGVYKATDDEHNNSFVALNILAPIDFQEPTEEARFEKQLTLRRDLRHPHLAEVHDFGRTESGQYFVVMELVQGTTLAERIHDTGNPLQFEEMLRILSEIASGVSSANSRGIVFGNLSPSNILLVGPGTTKVTALGLGGQNLPPCVGNELDEGRLCYMSPEQREGGTLDGRGDVYSLGVIALEMAIGRLPSQGGIHEKMDSVHHQLPIRSLRANGGSIPKWYETFILVCTDKQPHERFQSMEEVVVFLERRMRRLGLIDDGGEHEPLHLRLLSWLLNES